jgi:hypothetical protein
MNTKKSLDITWDKVIIIDCLSEKERTDWKISEDLINFLCKNNIKCEPFNVCTKKSLEQVLNVKLWNMAKLGQKFCMHVIAHGNKNRLAIGGRDGVPMDWAEFENILTKINNTMSNSLLLNMSSCFGLHAIKIADRQTSYPFFGLIGYDAPLKINDAKLINQLFYSNLKKNTDVPSVVEAIKKEKEEFQHLYCISTPDYKIIKSHLS